MVSPALAAAYRASPDVAEERLFPGCAGVVADMAGPFMVWPDARQGTLAVRPQGLAHAVAACGLPAFLGPAALRRMGVGAPLLAALRAGQAVGPVARGPR